MPLNISGHLFRCLAESRTSGRNGREREREGSLSCLSLGQWHRTEFMARVLHEPVSTEGTVATRRAAWCDLQRVCGAFGMEFFGVQGGLVHDLRSGHLFAATWDLTQWPSGQAVSFSEISA